MSPTWNFERLAVRRAILFADLVESVRVFQTSEAEAFDRWRRYVDQVRDSLLPTSGGRFVRIAGDGLLIEFVEAAPAVKLAFELHLALQAHNEGIDEDGSFALRIGLHVAEVARSDNDLWGAGVNLAQRLSTLAAPGSTVASAEFRAELGDGVQADIVDLGERILKHLAQPVRAFELLLPGARPTVRLPRSEDLRPAVAVVPFLSMPHDPQHDVVGHALADDIIASLARHPGLRVISRASTAAVRGQQLPPERLRELLGASFILSGHFYVRGTRMRLAAELAELQGGEVLWAGALAGEVDALFEGQDELVPHLVGQVSQHVLAHEVARVRSLPMDSLTAYSLLLGAEGLLSSLVPADFRRARELLEHLTERHPRQAVPHAVLSEWHVVALSQGWSERPEEAKQRVLQSADAALQAGPDQAAAHVAQGVAQVFVKSDHDVAASHFERALQIEPQNAKAWARLSETHSESGSHEQALGAARRAIELSPLDPWSFVYECAAARAAYIMREWPLAEQHARRSVRLNATHAPGHRHLVAALWQQGLEEAARRAAADYMRLVPGATVANATPASLSAEAEARLRRSGFSQCLLAAGIPFH